MVVQIVESVRGRRSLQCDEASEIRTGRRVLDETPDEYALYTGVFLRHPNLRLILALPTLGWRIGEHILMGRGPEDADIDPAHVAQVLRELYYETALAGSRNSLLPTLEVTTPDHILFGTDWPAAPEPTVIHNIDNLTSFEGFTEDELRGVERDNALGLFPCFA
ncbi:amidohydrolase family protein [Streptomyces sp. NPDC048309]|uniref:amidohydrolase family protein n=1 Tax=Streptomyces sp. NPDC048309 TaxID=3154618 RepID=UPI0033FBD92D